MIGNPSPIQQLSLSRAGLRPDRLAAHKLYMQRGVRFASLLATALLGGHFEHPARQLGVVSNVEIRDHVRSRPEFSAVWLKLIRPDAQNLIA